LCDEVPDNGVWGSSVSGCAVFKRTVVVKLADLPGGSCFGVPDSTQTGLEIIYRKYFELIV